MRTVRIMVMMLAASFALCGCTARELEERVFPQAMELDWQDGGLTGGFGDFMVEGETVAQIRENYQAHIDKYLDLGHLKAIVLGKNLLKEQEQAKRVLLELEKMPVIPGNSLIFQYDYQDGESYLAQLAKKGKVPGKYLVDLYKNNPARSRTATLATLLGREL